MAFREVPRPPAGAVIEPPRTTGLFAVTAPPLKLFSNEIMFWRAQQKEADKAGNATVRRFAEVSLKKLREAALGRKAIEELQASSTLELEIIGDWYMTSTLALAMGHMLKEVVALDDQLGLSFESNVAMAVDYFNRDPFRSGMHAKDGFVRDTLNVTPPKVGESSYYEGDVIYVRGDRPADPTTAFVEDYQGFYGVPFRPDQYISLVPRLKSSYWAGETASDS